MHTSTNPFMLQTRQLAAILFADIAGYTALQADKAGYLGWSCGGFNGGIMPAVEKRFKAVVLNVGGMEMERALPEVDQINYLPRVKQPVLMLNGKFDMFFPIETSEKPIIAWDR